MIAPSIIKFNTDHFICVEFDYRCVWEVIILRVLDAKRDYPRIFKDYTIQSDSKE
nr:hypothetical protein [Sedimentibacter sp.]